MKIRRRRINRLLTIPNLQGLLSSHSRACGSLLWSCYPCLCYLMAIREKHRQSDQVALHSTTQKLVSSLNDAPRKRCKEKLEQKFEGQPYLVISCLERIPPN